RAILDAYQAEYDGLWFAWTSASWEAAISGKKEAFDAVARAELALDSFHSNPDTYKAMKELLKSGDQLEAQDRRALEVAMLELESKQLPEDKLERMAELSAKIGQAFNTFRAELDGSRVSNNDLLTLLAKERDSNQRMKIWKALKQVGPAVGPDLVRLAEIRNEAARERGFESFWDMEVRMQEHDPKILLSTFAELEALTAKPYRDMKAELDAELARRFDVSPDALMPWHYDDPFFQAAPPSEKLDLDEFYKDKTKEEIVEIAIRFYDDINMQIQDIVDRSDLYEKEGKDQHAFCEDMNRKGDIRTLQNIRPTAEWMDTMLHECGHAVYDKYVDPSLPFNLRAANHSFTTEGVAMLFGALAKNPMWIIAYAGGDEKRVNQVADAIVEQRRREQLIFCRWSLVMLNFEKALYDNPRQDLNKLWWDYVERFQFLKRPDSRNEPDWATKPHFTIAPVYYHNYMLGELFSAQARSVLARKAGHKGPASGLSFNGRKDFGDFLKSTIFKPGKSCKWPAFVTEATGEALTAKYFAEELGAGS
ncbi:MAG: M2 family metallopeptidase, partial [Planctomycetota bacterium]